MASAFEKGLIDTFVTGLVVRRAFNVGVRLRATSEINAFSTGEIGRATSRPRFTAGLCHCHSLGIAALCCANGSSGST